MQILHKAEVAGGLPSDAKPIKMLLEEMSPVTTELSLLRLEVFPWCSWGFEKPWVRGEVQEDFPSIRIQLTSKDMIMFVLIQI